MSNRKHTAETRAKMSRSHRGKIIPPETREKMSKSHLGKKFTDEHRKNMSKAQHIRNAKRRGGFYKTEVIHYCPHSEFGYFVLSRHHHVSGDCFSGELKGRSFVLSPFVLLTIGFPMEGDVIETIDLQVLYWILIYKFGEFLDKLDTYQLPVKYRQWSMDQLALAYFIF